MSRLIRGGDGGAPAAGRRSRRPSVRRARSGRFGRAHHFPSSRKSVASGPSDRAPHRGARVSRIAILGAGSWGTALAIHLGHAGHDVRLWGRDSALVDRMVSTRSNPGTFRTYPLHDAVEPTASIAEALDAADFVIVAVPSHGVRHVLALAAASVPASAIVVSATKGIEGESLLRMSEVVEAELGGPQRIAVMSGPSFALEVARQRPTAVSVASRDAEVAARSRA